MERTARGTQEVPIVIIVSHHRNADLAERHLRELQKKYPSAELISRRNEFGRYSSRGHVFVFEVQQEEKSEFVVHFEYGEKSKKKGDQFIRFQVHVIGPSGASDNEAIEAIRMRNAGESWPKGWKLQEINWSKRNEITRTDPLPQQLRKAAIGGGVATVASRKVRKVRK